MIYQSDITMHSLLCWCWQGDRKGIWSKKTSASKLLDSILLSRQLMEVDYVVQLEISHWNARNKGATS